MKITDTQYRCRRCGEIDVGGTTGYNATKVICQALDIINGKPVPGIPQNLISIHSCKDGGTGVTDFIGYSEPRTDH